MCVIRHPQFFDIEDFKRLAGELRESLVEGQKYALLVDLRKVDPLRAGARARQQASEVLRENDEFLEKFVVCEARMISGSMSRGIITVVDWLAPRAWPVRNFGSGEIAEHWLRAQLPKFGLEAPEEPIWTEC